MIGKLIGSAGFLSSGGTIGGDLTITGDLTVVGSTTNTYDEQIQGLHHVYVDDTTLFQSIIEQDGTGDAALKFDLTGVRSWLIGLDNSDSDKFKISMDANDIKDSNFLTIDTSGNVGIGTDSPSTMLDITASASGDATLQLDSSANTSGISQLRSDTDRPSDGGSMFRIQVYNQGTEAGAMYFIRGSADTKSDIAFNTSNSERMRIDEDGNVGIGHSNPQDTLSLSSSSGAGLNMIRADSAITSGERIGQISFVGTENSHSNFGYGARIEALATEAWTEGSAEGTKLVFHTTDNSSATLDSRMTIDHNGNVGIGVTPDDSWNTFTALQIGETGAIFGHADGTGAGSAIHMSANTYYNSGWKYLIDASDEATRYTQENGRHQFFTTSAGTHSNAITFTENFRIDTNSRISLSNNDSGGTGGEDSTSGNTILGYLSGAAIQSGGLNNTTIGHKAGNAITTADNNVFIGALAGSTHLTGGRNTAIGTQAMFNTDADSDSNSSISNVFIGAQAGGGTWAGETANHNVGIGDLALGGALEGGDGTVAIGSGALVSLTSGAGNIAIGFNAGYNLTTNAGCTYIGYESGASAGGNVHNHNTGVGYRSLKSITTGSRNLAIGFESAEDLTAGSDNIAIGYLALNGMTTDANASENIGIGNYVMDEASNSASTAHNVCIGHQSGTLLTGDQNTCVGHTSGNTITSGEKNTIIGATSDTSGGTTANATAIGFGVTTQGNNTVTLGNADVTAVYMGSDKGARVYAERLDLKRAAEMCSLRMSTFDTAADTASTIYLETSNHDTADNYAAVDANDILGQVYFNGSDGTGAEAGGWMRCTAAETWDSDSRGTTFTLALVPSGANSTTLTTRIAIDGSGELSADLNDTSDVNLKENVKTINDGLSIVKQINPVTFDWKEKSKGSNSGFIAQEIEKLLPNDVSGEDYITPKDGEQAENMGKSINVTGIVAHLVKAVQELTAKVEALEAK